MNYKPGSKDTTDGNYSLNVNWLNQHGYLTPGSIRSICWTRRGKEIGDIGLRAEDGRVVLAYHSCIHGGEWENVEEPIELTWTPCNYGGQRPWFVCPGANCGRRVGVLYGAGKYFLCSQCYNLAYDCQNESKHERLLRKAQNIRQSLGGSASMADMFPDKPKGMHRKTYRRLYNQAKKTELLMWSSIYEWLSKAKA